MLHGGGPCAIYRGVKPLPRIPSKPALWRWAVALGIVIVAWLLAIATQRWNLTSSAMSHGDDFFYDTYYRLRPIQSQADGDVVIVAVDQQSLDQVKKAQKRGWPWPREFWGYIANCISDAGAKAIAFDILFDQISVYQNETGDDDQFAGLISELKSPIVLGSEVSREGNWGACSPLESKAWKEYLQSAQSKARPLPSLGAVNLGSAKIYYRYVPEWRGRASLAVATIKAAGEEPRLSTDSPFLLHYYGPHADASGKQTFRYVPAHKVLAAKLGGPEVAKQIGITPELFRGKIVLIGAIATGTYDLKATPLSDKYPGVEVQATAVANLLNGQAVRPVPTFWQWVAPLLCAAFATLMIIFPRRALLKMAGPLVAVAAILGVGILLFRGRRIVWLPPLGSLLAIGLATPAAFSWTYFVEDRRRRFMLKALSKVVSPAVAEQLARDPQRLALGTVRTDLTVLFTDLANFTDLSESMDVQRLGNLLNRYLGEMSDQVLMNDGTLDKYIGDAIMCFWNAPLPQSDHAISACRAALAIARREREILEELKAYGVHRIFTRIGINTTSAAVGFVGSSHLFNYTALGDGVNLASRLEGANKLYGTRILISETTADLVKDTFLLRKIDVLRVKGKRRPVAVFELLAEKGEDGDLRPLVEGYEAALTMYQAQRWEDARNALLVLRDRFAEDGAIAALLKRVEHHSESPPPADWDGVYVAKDK